MLRLKPFKVKLFCTVIDIMSVCVSIPIEIPILWPRTVMFGPRPRVLLTLPLATDVRGLQEYWHLHRFSDRRNTLIYAQSTSRTLPTCDVSLGSLAVAMPEAGDFVESLELYV